MSPVCWAILFSFIVFIRSFIGHKWMTVCRIYLFACILFAAFLFHGELVMVWVHWPTVVYVTQILRIVFLFLWYSLSLMSAILFCLYWDMEIFSRSKIAGILVSLCVTVAKQYFFVLIERARLWAIEPFYCNTTWPFERT